MMTAHTVVRSCSELSVGDHVEAQRDGRVLHRGRVLAVVPALELFWISDAKTGTRKLLDLEMLSVLRCPVRAVPETAANPVWVLLYRNGLPSKKIAELTGAPLSAVSYHLSAARAVDRDLQTDHEAAAGQPAPAALAGIIRMHQVIQMVQETGRYPSRHSDDASERKLAAWLRRRRRDARAGILAPELRDGLAVLPDWQRKPRDVAGDVVWKEQLAALVAFRLGGNDWPRRKAADTELERELGFWLHSQRFKLRRGNLNSEQAEELNAALPGWLAGRKRGKKAQLSPEQIHPGPVRPGRDLCRSRLLEEIFTRVSLVGPPDPELDYDDDCRANERIHQDSGPAQRHDGGPKEFACQEDDDGYEQGERRIAHARVILPGGSVVRDPRYEPADKPDGTVGDSGDARPELGSSDHEVVEERQKDESADRVDENKPLEVSTKDDL